MMKENRISATLSPENHEQIMKALGTIREMMPFLQDLSPADRMAMLKMGDRSQAFVSKAMEVATQNPDFLPRSFNVEEMRKDVALLLALHPIRQALTQMQELVEDTYLQVGSEAYAAALTVYHYAKGYKQGTGLDEVLDDLGRRFARKSTTTTPEG